MTYDTVLRGGIIYDGSGNDPFQADIAIRGDVIAEIAKAGTLSAKQVIDVDGLAVAPGFINMLSWSVESLIVDGHSQSEIRQGVTLEVMGEGESMGPLNETMKQDWQGGILGNPNIRYDIEWTTLGEYLDFLEKRGVSPNITSYVGSGTLRIHEMGYDNREPSDSELAGMKSLVAQAMEEGAVGMSAALIYPPAAYSKTAELRALVSVVAGYDGVYSSHLRSEGVSYHKAVDEFISIVRDTGVRGEIYHLKVRGKSNWHKMDEVIGMIETARAEGLQITADFYPYPYSGTGLSACVPAWAHEGGQEAFISRLKQSETRNIIKNEMQVSTDQWENLFYETGADGIVLSGFGNEALKQYTGMSLADVSKQLAKSPEDTLLDLLIEDNSRIFTLYFCMSEDNLRKQVPLSWLSFCSDAESIAPTGAFLGTNPHPRAYGAFARVISKYVVDEGLLPLKDAIRKLTALPASVLKIKQRGKLETGYFADIVVFDPDQIQDHATPTQPHQYSTGMTHVFVNGVAVLKDGEHTGAKPGRVVRGPGWKPV